MKTLRIYGFTVHPNGTATLDLLKKVAPGKGILKSRWAVVRTIKTAPKAEIEKECEALNRQIAQDRQ